jgi:hypothetical protein
MSASKALAFLLVIFFVIIALVVVLIWSVQSNILNADAHVTALEEAGVFEVPYQLIRDGDIPGVVGLLLTQGPLSVVSGADREAVARELAPPDWLRDQLEQGVRDLVAVAEAPELGELPNLTISLREVKVRALGEPGDRALSIVVNALPECPPGQAPLDLGSDTPICKPAELNLNSFLAQLKTFLPPLVERLPDTYQVEWQPEQVDVLQDLQQAGRTLDRLRYALLLLVALDAALLGLIWLLAVRSPGEWLRWTGMPLLLVGLLALLLAVLIPRVIAWGVERAAVEVEADVPVPLTESLEVAIQDFSTLLLRPALFFGVALAFVGLLLTLASPLFPGRQRRVPSMRARSAR